MNWLLGNRDQPQNDAPETTPDADELRSRRLARLEEAQAAEAARRKDFEDRKAKWQASKRAAASASSSSIDAAAKSSEPSDVPTKPATPPAPVKPVKPVQPSPPPQSPPPQKRAPPPLPSLPHMVSRHVARVLAIALTASSASEDTPHIPQLLDQLRADVSVTDSEVLLLNADTHPDDILLHRINSLKAPLEYLFSCYERCSNQRSEVTGNKRLNTPEYQSRIPELNAVFDSVHNRIFVYTGMLLSGAFMEIESASPQAFAEYLLDGRVPSGFIRALLNRHAQSDAALDDILPAFKSVFIYIRSRALSDSLLSSSSFLKPLTALSALLHHKELCRLLTADSSLIGPTSIAQVPLAAFQQSSYLYPFFQVSALPGAPAGHIPTFPEDPSIAATMFPNPSMLSRTEAEGVIFSLRSSLSIYRNLLAQACLALCKAGPDSRNVILTWFANLFNLNKKRAAMQPDPRVTSRDGFMLNVMFVLLKLCEPIVTGRWKMLQKIDDTFPQSTHRIDYSEETRLAADTEMLKFWWADKRNENAQESLARSLAVAEREYRSSTNGAGSSSAQPSASETAPVEKKEVSSEFSFVTECFWLALRGVQLGFVPVVNVYEDGILRTLQRIREIIDGMESSKERGTLPPDQEAQLTIFKRRFDLLLQAKLCYDVYLLDPELLTILVRFVLADAEYLMKRLLMKDGQEITLPLPLPVDPTFASLPEHTVETITSVLLTTMHTDQRIVFDHSALLEEMVSFCVIGSASPLHIKNPYLRAKFVEFLYMVFPRRPSIVDEEDETRRSTSDPAMEALFATHSLSRKFLPSALFRLYVDVEHTGSHTQFYDKFSIRYHVGSIVESLWDMADYRVAAQEEAKDETRFLGFVNMALNDANHLLDSVLDDLEEMNTIETLISSNSPEWQALTDEEKEEKKERLHRLEGNAKSYNHYANSNMKLLWLLTGDDVMKRVFLRDEMVSRLAEMLNYLLERLCGQRCNDLKVSDPTKVAWNPRKLLKRIIETYVHFHGDDKFATAVARDGRSYKVELFSRAINITMRRRLLPAAIVQSFEELAAAAARAHEAENEEEEDLGEIPDEFLDPIMSVLMRNPVRLPTSGNVMDRAVISRILLSDKVDPFNRKLLTNDMLEEEVELKRRIDEFVREKKRAKSRGGSSS